MPRIARRSIKAPFLHVMVQGINKEYIFNKEEYIKLYLKIFNKYKIDYEFTLLSYCMMNNHAHFLIYTDDIESFSKFMQKVNLSYTIKYNEMENRTGVLFKNRFKTESIDDKQYLLNCIKYIHNNPVKAKIVEKCEDYKYSSYTDYVNKVGVAKNKIVEEVFGSNCDYLFLFEHTYEKKFMDVDENVDMNYYIKERYKGIFE